MTREERRAKILETLHLALHKPTGRDPATNMMLTEKLKNEALVMGLEELLDFASDIESIASSQRDVADNARNR